MLYIFSLDKYFFILLCMSLSYIYVYISVTLGNNITATHTDIYTYTHIYILYIYDRCSAKRDLTSKFSNLSLWSHRKKHVLLILIVVLFLLCIRYNYVNNSKEGGNLIWNCSTFFRNTYRSCVIEKLLYQYDMQAFFYHHSKNDK